MSGYYTPSGVPQTNSKAASAAVRTEFQSISTAFSLFPTLAGNAGRAFVVNGSGDAIVLTVGQLSLAGNLTTSGALTTTGAFSTVFAQTASVTLTLPSTSDTLATATSVALKANIASPTFTGIPAGPTATPGTNTTQFATTQFVTTAVVDATTGVASFNTRTGSVTLQVSDVTGVGGALQTTVVPLFNNVGRNKIHNPLFNYDQRGTGPFTTNGAYTLDRWLLLLSTDTNSVTAVALTDADRAAIGDEEASGALQNAFTGNAGAGSYSAVAQRIENARRLSGKTVTLSFKAKVLSGTVNLGMSLDQLMGTGGSPSANVLGVGQSVTLSTTWTPFQKTFTLGSLSGDTLGTNVDHCTQLNFWFSSGSTNASRSGSVGVQVGTVLIWGVQLEVASTATALEKLDTETAFAQCQRFYQALTGIGGMYSGGSGQSNFMTIIFPVLMRAAPSVIITPSGGTGYSSVLGNSSTGSSFTALITSNVTGQVSFNYAINASADL